MNTSDNNLLLSALSPDSRQLILSAAEHLDLPSRTMLMEQEEAPMYVWFITSGIASVVVAMPDGNSTEVILMGHEGVVGIFSLLGSAAAPAKCFMQVPGSGWRLPLAEMRKIFAESEEVRTRVLELVQQQTLSMAQLAACNRLHDAESRLARWLLMVSDRLESDTLNLTQEFIAQMLGTQRTTVVLVAGLLQAAGLIVYSRGQVKINSHEDLESAACDCYPVMDKLFRKLYDDSKVLAIA